MQKRKNEYIVFILSMAVLKENFGDVWKNKVNNAACKAQNSLRWVSISNPFGERFWQDKTQILRDLQII